MDEPISAMPAAPNVTDGDLIPIVQGGVNYYASRSQMLAAAVGEIITLKGAVAQEVRLQSGAAGCQLELNDVDSSINATSQKIVLGAGNTSLLLNSLAVGTAAIIAPSTGEIILQVSASACELTLDGVTDEIILLASGGCTISYVPALPASWNGSPPVDVATALDRCAALLKSLNGGVGP